MIRSATVVCGKDLRIEARSRVVVGQVAPFVLAVVMLFGFALDADSAALRRTSSGLFWVTVVFAAVLVTQRSAALEVRDGVADSLRLSGLSPSGIFVGKAASLVVQLLAVEVVLALSMIVVYDLSPTGIALLGVTTLTATLAIAAAGALYGPLVGGTRSSGTVLPLLLLPALAPVLLAATRGFEIAMGRAVGTGWPWAGMLGILALTYWMLGMAVWGPLLEDL